MRRGVVSELAEGLLTVATILSDISELNKRSSESIE